jgi:hypothetical protein
MYRRNPDALPKKISPARRKALLRFKAFFAPLREKNFVL